MPRKRKEQPDNYNKAFPSAMRKLMEKKGTTQNELADHLQKTRQSVSYYCDGSSSPDWETIVKIADFFEVSTDYLLGRTQDPNRQPCAADDLGLSAAAIAYIRQYSHPSSKEMEEFVRPSDCLNGLSMIIENGGFVGLAGEIKRFRDVIAKNIELSKLYQDATPAEVGDDYYMWRHAAEEDLLAKNIQQTVESQHPELQGAFEVLVGRHIVEHQKRIIVDEFEEILRRITNYNKFKEVTVKW